MSRTGWSPSTVPYGVDQTAFWQLIALAAVLLLPVRRLTTDADTLAWSWGCVTLTPSLTVTVRRMVVRVLLSAWVCAGTARSHLLRISDPRKSVVAVATRQTRLPWTRILPRTHSRL